MRRTLLLSALALLPGLPGLPVMSAFGDQSMPEPGKGGRGHGRVDWTGRCAERLERARDELAKTESRWKGVRVESRAEEIGEAGDPTAKSTVDIVELRVDLGSLSDGAVGPSSHRFLARVEPYRGQMLLNPVGWVRISGFPIAKKYDYESKTDRYGTIEVDRSLGGAAREFERAFTPAIEDCLKMKKAK